MSEKKENMSEDEVFNQELSQEELENVAGGKGLANRVLRRVEGPRGQGCYRQDRRDIYDGAFPNCAATVEDDSFCWTNDACVKNEVKYTNMNSCFRVWE